MPKPEDKPGNSEYGQFIARCVQTTNMTGQQAREAFGAAPGGRSWKEIGDSAKPVMRDYPKQ